MVYHWGAHRLQYIVVYRNWTGDSEINQFLPPHQLLITDKVNIYFILASHIFFDLLEEFLFQAGLLVGFALFEFH